MENRLNQGSRFLVSVRRVRALRLFFQPMRGHEFEDALATMVALLAKDWPAEQRKAWEALATQTDSVRGEWAYPQRPPATMILSGTVDGKLKIERREADMAGTATFTRAELALPYGEWEVLAQARRPTLSRDALHWLEGVGALRPCWFAHGRFRAPVDTGRALDRLGHEASG